MVAFTSEAAVLTEELTKDWLINNALVGIDTTDDDAVEFPDEHYTNAIRGAISTVENDLHIVLDYTQITFERQDAIDADANGWYLMYLRNRPLREVTGLSVQFADFDKHELPYSWVQISNEKIGQIQVMPGKQAGSAHLVGARLPLYGLTGNYGRPYTPRWWGFDYTAGFTDRRLGLAMGSDLRALEFNAYGPVTVKSNGLPIDSEEYTVTITGLNKETGASLVESLTFNSTSAVRQTTSGEFSTVIRIQTSTDGDDTSTFDVLTQYMMPDLFYQMISWQAAIPILDTAGDLILGAGIASQSASVDSLNTSVASTSSPTNSGYGARIKSYQKQYSEALKRIKRKWSMPKTSII
jgi:hypothetical protein